MLRFSCVFCVFTILLVGLLLAGSSPAAAQYALRSAHVGAGHAAMTGGSYAVSASIGQPAVRIVGDGAPYYLGNGFWFAGQNSDVALPVELAGFDAALESGSTPTSNQTVRLRWRTVSETNNAGFHVERAVDARAFQALGFVGGQGTTEAPQTYRFADTRLPFAADSLSYRLRQVDHDGTATLSDAVTVPVGVPQRLALHGTFPNPVRQTATLRYELPTAADVRIVVYNLLGQRVATLVEGPQPAGRVETRIDAGRWPSGVYFVRLVADRQMRTQRLTVVR
jgi:hypothetical protein